MPAVLPFTGVLPHPDIPGALLIQPTPELLARAALKGTPTVAAWGHPALLDLTDATRLAYGVHGDDQVNDQANAARQTYRDVRAAQRILKGLFQDRQEKATQAEAAARYNETLPAKRAAELAEAKARRDPRAINPDDDLPSFETFLATAAKETVK